MTAILTTKSELREVLGEILKPKPNPEQLFTIAQTAAKLGKSKSTIYRMIQAGRIKATADGRYISQQAINNYLNI